MIQLTRSNPVRKMHRFYAMHLAPTLFGEWGLIVEWGRIGSPGRMQERIFGTEEAAHTALTKQVRFKTKRGYICAGQETA